MKPVFHFSFFLLLGGLLLHFTYFKQNTVQGKISILNDCPPKRVIHYADGTDIMHSNDPMATPNRNVIIILHPLSFEAELKPTENAYVSQQEQTFLPHVLPVVMGSKVSFLNEDEFFHNVQSLTRGARFNIGRRAPGVAYSIRIKKAGLVELSCDIHEHMNATILSLETPYFTRIESDGSYTLPNLPNGKYRIEVFHPNCDNLEKEVEIKGGKIHEFDFQLNFRP